MTEATFFPDGFADEQIAQATGADPGGAGPDGDDMAAGEVAEARPDEEELAGPM